MRGKVLKEEGRSRLSGRSVPGGPVKSNKQSILPPGEESRRPGGKPPDPRENE